MNEVDALTFNVVQEARNNEKFRRVLWTGDRTQVVLMAIAEGDDIGGEVHEGHDQLLFFVSGQGHAVIGDAHFEVAEGDVSIVPSGVFHNFKNTGEGMLKLFTTYSPPEHAAGAEQGTKHEAA